MSSRGLCCVSQDIREIPSEMEFHGLLCSLKWNLSVKADANSDRNAHDTDAMEKSEKSTFIHAE